MVRPGLPKGRAQAPRSDIRYHIVSILQKGHAVRAVATTIDSTYHNGHGVLMSKVMQGGSNMGQHGMAYGGTAIVIPQGCCNYRNIPWVWLPNIWDNRMVILSITTKCRLLWKWSTWCVIFWDKASMTESNSKTLKTR